MTALRPIADIELVSLREAANDPRQAFTLHAEMHVLRNLRWKGLDFLLASAPTHLTDECIKNIRAIPKELRDTGQCTTFIICLITLLLMSILIESPRITRQYWPFG